MQVGGTQLWPLLGKHLQVTGEAMAIACLIAIPIALWLGHLGRGELAASTIANVGRAVPSFAVLVFFSAYLGFNVTNLVFAMVLLAVPPIFTNTYVGVRQVDRDAVDAARGMGMTGAEVARRVELPLSLPLIFGGIRTSAVNVLATATLGPFVGVVTLGDPIINTNVYGQAGQLGGAILVAALALASEVLFSGLQRVVTPRGLKPPSIRRKMSRMKTRPALAAAVAAMAAFAVAACGDDDKNSSSEPASTGGSTSSKVIQPIDGAASTPVMTVGSKNFTEEFILGEIYAQSLEAAGYKVKKQLNLGSEQIAYKALKAGKVDAYPEYTGTMLTSFYKVKTEDVPKDSSAAYEQAQELAEQDGVEALAPTPFTDSNGFAMTMQKADELGVENLSDLSDKAVRADARRSAGVPPARGLQAGPGEGLRAEVQEVHPGRPRQAPRGAQERPGRRLAGVHHRRADQGRQSGAAGDDKHLFPPYNVSFLVRDETLKGHPGMDKVVEQVQEGLTTEVMQELNSRVDLDKQKPAAVAKQYLTESGYLE